MDKPRRLAIIAVFIGLIGFLRISRNPRFELFHAVDILQLIATGMCFGVALAIFLRGRRS